MHCLPPTCGDAPESVEIIQLVLFVTWETHWGEVRQGTGQLEQGWEDHEVRDGDEKEIIKKENVKDGVSEESSDGL